MRDLFLFAIAGFAASLVDGALGMGFGPTSSSILLAAGLAPTAVSASVNLAKVVTGIVAAISHWKFRNLDKALVLQLAIPGCLGALVGVYVLSSIDGTTLRPYLAMLLTIIGIRILVRFARPIARAEKATAPISGSLKRELVFDRRGVKTAAFLGGVTNGMIGAWGPVVTPFLLHRNVRPRYAIGCVNTAEVAVASASAFSLIASLGRSRYQRPDGAVAADRRSPRRAGCGVVHSSRRAGTHGCLRRRSAPVDQCARSDGLGRTQVGPGAVGDLREHPRGDRRCVPLGARAHRSSSDARPARPLPLP